MSSVRIRRDNLFWGLVFLGLGGVPLLVRAGTIDPSVFVDVGRWWPVALIAIGLLLILGRSRAALLGVVVAGLTIGTLGGGMLATGSGIVGGLTDCGALGGEVQPGQSSQQGGTFQGDASVAVEVDCGAVELVVVPGADWDVVARHGGEPPRIEADASSLTIASPGGFAVGDQDWRIELPADRVRELRYESNAGAGTLQLDGATLGRLAAELNAGDLRILAGAAAIDEVRASVNAGRIRLTLGGGAARGSLSLNAGSLELCVPPDVALALRVEDQVAFGHNLRDRGLVQDGDRWTREGTGGTIELTVEGNAASLTLDPDGGC